jgi:hypothetical protein
VFEELTDSVTIKQHRWGLFTIAFLNARYEQFEKSSSFLYGNALPKYMDQCIYLADRKRSLFLVGQTKLTGDLTVPDAGIKPGFVNQKGFAFESLYEGKPTSSKPVLPPLDSVEVLELKKMVSLIDSAVGGLVRSESNSDSIAVGFDSETYLYFSKDSISLSNKTLSGNIIVISARHISIDSFSLLKDIIIVAPSVTLGKGFKGNIQVFATDTLIVKEGVTLNYPSVLALVSLAKETGNPKIMIEKDVSICGIILAFKSHEKNLPSIRIDKGFMMEGIYYCNGFTAMAGKVNGIVLADLFIHESGNILYENYLVDVQINRREMSGFFIGSPIFSSPGKKEIINWFH